MKTNMNKSFYLTCLVAIAAAWMSSGAALAVGVSSGAHAVEVSNGSLDRIEPFRSKFVAPRNVHVWLPAGYTTDKRYAVLYMHDGQTLFDAKASWNGQEWGVDDIAGALQAQGKLRDFIVVGIFNGGPLRWPEYWPQQPFEMLDSDWQAKIYAAERSESVPLMPARVQSDAYLKFLVTELKPYIDRTYAVDTDRDSTFVMGSSMGGLISLYAISEYPEIFGAAACLSTHWPGILPVVDSPAFPAFLDWFAQHLPAPENTRIYFDYGSATLDQHYPPLQARFDRIMKQNGYNSDNWQTRSFPGAAHTEDAWRERLHIPLEFLLGN